MEDEQTWIPRRGRRGGMNSEIGIDVYTLMILCME